MKINKLTLVVAISTASVMTCFACYYDYDEVSCHAASSTFTGHDCGVDLYDSTTAGQTGLKCYYDSNDNGRWTSCQDDPISGRCSWTFYHQYCDTEGDVQTSSTPESGDLPSVITGNYCG